MGPTDNKVTIGLGNRLGVEQATKHQLNQCWSRTMKQYDITKPQWVKGAHLRMDKQ